MDILWAYHVFPIVRHSHFTPSSFEQWQSQHLPGATSVRRRGDGRDGVRKKEGIPAVEISCVAVVSRGHETCPSDRGNEDATMEWGILLGQVGLRACYTLAVPIKKGDGHGL